MCGRGVSVCVVCVYGVCMEWGVCVRVCVGIGWDGGWRAGNKYGLWSEHWTGTQRTRALLLARNATSLSFSFLQL